MLLMSNLGDWIGDDCDSWDCWARTGTDFHNSDETPYWNMIFLGGVGDVQKLLDGTDHNWLKILFVLVRIAIIPTDRIVVHRSEILAVSPVGDVLLESDAAGPSCCSSPIASALLPSSSYIASARLSLLRPVFVHHLRLRDRSGIRLTLPFGSPETRCVTCFLYTPGRPNAGWRFCS